MTSQLPTTLNRIWLSCIIGLLSFLIFTNTALAHTPHDDIYEVEISPNYSQNQTLFVIVRGSLLQSTDGGDSWKRIVRGLDNRFNLNSIDIYPQNQQIVYLSSLGDGIYKSNDAGTSWQKINRGLDSFAIDQVAVSPYSPDLALATGEADGLYLTQNGGKSWNQVVDEAKITAIAFLDSPTNILIGDRQGNLYQSQDGQNWQNVEGFSSNSTITSIAISPDFEQNQTVLVGTETDGIYRSDDGGKTFTSTSQGIKDKLVRDITFTSDNHIYVSTWHEGIFKSEDLGNSWEEQSQKGLSKDGQADEERYNRPHFSQIQLSDNFTEDRTLFLAGFDGLFKSTDRGRTWKQLDTLSPRIVTVLDISPNYGEDSTIAIATYNEEAYLSDTAGETWRQIDQGLDKTRHIPTIRYKSPFYVEVPRFYSIVFSPDYAQDQTLFASVRYQFIRSTNNGRSWQRVNIPTKANRTIREIIIVPSPNYAIDRNLFLATYSGAIYQSQNKGKSFKIVGDVGYSIRSFVISPNFSVDRTFYAASYSGGLLKSTDAGRTWESILTGELSQISWHELAISPNFAQDRTIIGGTNKGVYLTQDGGDTWTKLTGDFDPDGFVRAIAISPEYAQDQTFIVTIKGFGTFKTVDGGKTFSQIAQQLFEQNYTLAKVDNVPSTSVPIKFSPAYATDQTIYAYGTAGANIFKSTDGGDNWEIISIEKQEDLLDQSLLFLKLGVVRLKVYSELIYLIAFLISLPTYFIIGYFKLHKLISLKRWQTQLAGTFLTFVFVVVVLSIVAAK